MKNYPLTILTLLSVHFCFGQIGYSKMYDFDLAANFHNILLVEDTLIITGTAKDEDSNQWGALFVKMDTLGNVLDYNIYVDSMDSHIAVQKSYPLIKTSNDHYLMTGDLFNRPSDFLLTLSAQGEAITFWEYPYASNIFTSHPWELLEVNDGYLIFSTKQEDSYDSHVYITKINYEGEILWEERYGGSESHGSYIGSIWQQDDNTIVIGAAKVTNQIARPAPNTFYCTQNWIFAVDSLGAVKWEWTSEPCEANNVIGLQPSFDGGWVYASNRLQVFDQWHLGFAPLFVKRDSEFNLVWERQLADSYSASNNNLIDIKPSLDETWVGAGRWVLPEPYVGWSENHIYIPACLYKLTDDGDSLWIRCDTVALDNEFGTGSHKYGGIVTLPSGSTIAVGSFSENLGGVGKSWAWVVKVDKDGCMEELCTFTDTDELGTLKENAIEIFPNPVNDFLHINTPENNYSISLFNAQGQLLKKCTDKYGEQTIDLSDLKGGVYFLEFKSKEKRFIEKILKM